MLSLITCKVGVIFRLKTTTSCFGLVWSLLPTTSVAHKQGKHPLSFHLKLKYIFLPALFQTPCFMNHRVLDEDLTIILLTLHYTLNYPTSSSFLLRIFLKCVSCSVMPDCVTGQGSLAGYYPWHSPGPIMEWQVIPFSKGSS